MSTTRILLAENTVYKTKGLPAIYSISLKLVVVVVLGPNKDYETRLET